MSGFLLHMGATVVCMHAGQAQPLVTSSRVTVEGQPVVTQSGLYTITGCALTGTPNPPCVTAQWTSAATRVTAGGVPVLLRDSQATCTASGTGLQVRATQGRVKGT
jgi:Domain of unknown function (DUF4280)